MNRRLKENAIPWTFKTWLANFKSVDLPIGDLAQDVSRDSEFPDSDDFEDIYDHICHISRNPAVVETFVEAWSFYLMST